MASIIPKEALEDFIRRTGWVPGQPPAQEDSHPPQNPAPQREYSIEELVHRGVPFFSDKKDASGQSIGVAMALQDALKGVGEEGIVASLPYLIAGKATAEKDNNYLWKNGYDALSEENIGIDKQGKFVLPGQPVVITVHGGGILTPERILKAYDEGLTPQRTARYTDDREFDDLLEGNLPSGESILLYTLADIKKGISYPFGRYAVVLDFKIAKGKPSGWHSKDAFLSNELVLARAGTEAYLDAYFEKAKHSDGTVGNWHRLNDIDSSVSQGRVLFLSDDSNGRDGSDLYGDGRFVGVAPKAPRAP